MDFEKMLRVVQKVIRFENEIQIPNQMEKLFKIVPVDMSKEQIDDFALMVKDSFVSLNFLCIYITHSQKGNFWQGGLSRNRTRKRWNYGPSFLFIRTKCQAK